MRLRVIAGVVASIPVVIAPGWAEDRSIGSERPWPPIVLSPPTDVGKSLLPPAPSAGIPDPGGCDSPLPCGARLLGTARRNGAVELQVPALRW